MPKPPLQSHDTRSLTPAANVVEQTEAVRRTEQRADGEPRATWRQQLAAAIRRVDDLVEILELDRSMSPESVSQTADFPLLVPRSFVDRMRPRDWSDPLLRQVLPLATEEQPVAGFVSDAVGDLHARRAPGLIHKYHGRVLLIANGACAVHCRYCFRRHYPYAEDPHRSEDWNRALGEIQADPTVVEVILSGGDPLTLNDRRLADLCFRLEQIPHLRRIRWHTRLPVVLPDRVTPEWIELLEQSPLQHVVVLHANHANELVADCELAIRRLAAGRVRILNQAVLLKGINDSIEALGTLSERLFELGCIPYYLHQLDRVAGAAHFEVAIAHGRKLVAGMRQRLPGYLVPLYVVEQPGQPHKTWIESEPDVD